MYEGEEAKSPTILRTCVMDAPLFAESLPKTPKKEVIDLSLSFFPADVPTALLAFGPSLNPKGIKEGDDVYFECHVKSNPPADNITWRHNVSATN